MTLESQYKVFQEKNPTSTFTFEEWKTWFGNGLKEGLDKYYSKEKPCIKHGNKYSINNPCPDCLREINKE